MESLERADAALLDAMRETSFPSFSVQWKRCSRKRPSEWKTPSRRRVAVYAEIEKQARFHLDILEGRRR
jgi:hypothetical protein